MLFPLPRVITVSTRSPAFLSFRHSLRKIHMASEESINNEVTQQTALLNELRLGNADATVVDEAKKKLGELKKSLALLKGAGGGKDTGKRKERLLLKTPKVRICTRCHPIIHVKVFGDRRALVTMAPGKCSVANTLNA
jgi:hypothetical protein